MCSYQLDKKDYDGELRKFKTVFFLHSLLLISGRFVLN